MSSVPEASSSLGTALRDAVDALARSATARGLVTVYDRIAGAVPHGAPDDVLRGRPLGHPLHPVLSDVPLGSWTSAVVHDLGGARYEAAARRLVGFGVVAAVPTALAGIADWRTTTDPARSVGAAHGSLNTAALLLIAASWRARRRGRRPLGVLLALAGLGSAGAAGYLGGHLVFVDRVPDDLP
jgi:uncharacterized membrane protein